MPRRTIVPCIAAAATEDVTTMLNQVHTAADLGADRRRTLLAEAEAYRLARTARLGAPTVGGRPARRRWFDALRPAPRRAAGAA
jgi:hypothetical protein